MIIRTNESKKLIKHANVNVNLTIKNIIQIKFGITVIVDVSQKMCEKKLYLESC